MRYVYDLVDSDGVTEYVGESKHPNVRFKEHTTHKPRATSPSASRGKFYGRTDLSLQIISSHDTRKESMKAEGQRKLSLGMEWTEKEGYIAAGLKASKSPKSVNKVKVKCPHCDMVSTAGAIGSHINHKH